MLQPSIYLTLLILLLTGCAQKLSTLEKSALLQGTELESTPFFPQDEYQCGPAALATILASSGIDVQPESLIEYVYLPKRKGSLQLELIAASRSFGRIPYTIKSELAPIAAELQAGHPVLVLQNFGTQSIPLYHYAVVVGLSSNEGVILRSGTRQRLVMSPNHFLATVRRAGSWGLVVLSPGELPPIDNFHNFLEALAALETTGNIDMAEKGYRTLLLEFPNNTLIMFGLANTLAANNQAAEAILVYSQLLEVQPMHLAAINNLADTFAGEHCYSKALQILDKGIQQSNHQSDFFHILQNSHEDITARAIQFDDTKCTIP